MSHVVRTARAYRRELQAKLDKIEEFLALADSLISETEDAETTAAPESSERTERCALSFRGTVPFDAGILQAKAS